MSYSPAEQTVLREVEEVYSGNLPEARRAWWSGATYPDPAAIGLAAEDVDIEIDGGKAPAWLIRAEASPRRQSAQSWSTAAEPRAGRPSCRPHCTGTRYGQPVDFLP